MQEAKAAGAEGSNQLKGRLSKALFELNLKLASCKSGTLVQVWMPEVTADGSMVLSAQGLPFAIAGIGDLLALFRCVSCRYRFSTDVTRPALMGAIGRVYSSCEPEMSHNVQKYDKQVYLRVSEAQRCRVHSTLVMPVFDGGDGDSSSFGARPVAVFELVQADKDVVFPAVIAELRKCLEDAGMFTSEPDIVTASVGLRNWPMHIDSSAFLRELSTELRPSLSNSAGRLLLENDIPDDEGPTGPAGQPAAAAEAAVAGASGGGDPMILGPATAARPAGSSVSTKQPVAARDGSETSAAVEVDAEMAGAADAAAGSGQGSAHMEGDAAAVPEAAAAVNVKLEAPPAGKLAAAETGKATARDKDEAQSKHSSLPMAGAQQQQQDDASSPALTTQLLNALTTAATNIQSQAQQQQVQPQQQQLTLDLSALLVNSMQTVLAQHAQAMQGLQQQQQQQQAQQQQQQQQQAALPAGTPDPAALSSAISTLIAAANAQASAAGSSPGAAANNQPLLTAVQQLQLLQQQLGGGSGGTDPPNAQQSSQPQQGTMRRSGSSAVNLGRAASAAAAATGEDIGSDDELFGSDEDDEGGFSKASRFGGSGGGNAANRPMGAGRKLTFEDLQAQFGLGLKEAAANLGICATTLKRACRRNGITRWPRRQIQKLNRTLNQMGQQGNQGPPIDELVQSAIRKNLKPDMLTPAVTASLQQQLLQQAGTNAGATRSSSGAMPIPRVGSNSSGHARYNSGSLTGLGGLSGSCGDGQTGGLGMLGGSTGALSNGFGNGGLGGFVGFSFPPGGDSAMGLAGTLMNDQQQQQQLLLQQLQQQQQMAAALSGMGGTGNLQMLLSGLLPQQDQQQQHMQILQSQASLAQGGGLQQLMQQQQVDGLSSVSGSYQQQQLLMQQQQQQLQQQHSLQGALSTSMMMPPAFKNTGTAAGGGGGGGDHLNGSTMQGAGLNVSNTDFALQQQQQQLLASVGINPATAGLPNLQNSSHCHSSNDATAARMQHQGVSSASGKLHSPAEAASEHASSVAFHHQQQQQSLSAPMTTAAAAATNFGDFAGNSGDGFFDLLDDGMLLDEGGLDLSAFAAFEQQQQ